VPQALRGRGRDPLKPRQAPRIAATEEDLAAIERKALSGVAGFGSQLLAGGAARPRDAGRCRPPFVRDVRLPGYLSSAAHAPGLPLITQTDGAAR
jgi:hypothetical protein